MEYKLKCAVCGEYFVKNVSPAYIRNNKYGFCCPKHRREHLDKINKTIFWKTESHIKVICDNCGEEFEAEKSLSEANIRKGCKEVRFCSRKCMYVYRKANPKEFQKTYKLREQLSKKMRGSKNPLYKNGNRIWADKYDYQFRPLLRKQIREKFDNTCCLCGRHKRDDEKHFACHHKDFNKKNNDIENFELLCPSCHQKKHRAEQLS